MSDPQGPSVPPQSTVPVPAAIPAADTRTLVIIVYGLYLAAVVSAGLAGVAGVVIAYIKRDETRGTIWESHFENQITAFWVWFIMFIVGCSTFWLLGLGFLIMGAAFVYFLFRTIKGLIRALDAQPYV